MEACNEFFEKSMKSQLITMNEIARRKIRSVKNPLNSFSQLAHRFCILAVNASKQGAGSIDLT